jgi:hypothetical protein
MRRLLIALLCAAFAVAMVSVSATTAAPGHAQAAKKKCKKSKKAVAAKKCKKHGATTTPPSGGSGGTTSPTPPLDTDGDGVPDSADNCVSMPNADQADADADGHGDVCDACPLTSNPGTEACPSMPTLADLTTQATICEGHIDDPVGSVTLSAPAVGDTFVTVTSGDATKVTVTNGGTTVMNGQTSGTVSMNGIAQGGPVTITASLNAGPTQTSEISVIPCM